LEELERKGQRGRNGQVKNHFATTKKKETKQLQSLVRAPAKRGTRGDQRAGRNKKKRRDIPHLQVQEVSVRGKQKRPAKIKKILRRKGERRGKESRWTSLRSDGTERFGRLWKGERHHGG